MEGVIGIDTVLNIAPWFYKQLTVLSMLLLTASRHVLICHEIAPWFGKPFKCSWHSNRIFFLQNLLLWGKIIVPRHRYYQTVPLLWIISHFRRNISRCPRNAAKSYNRWSELSARYIPAQHHLPPNKSGDRIARFQITLEYDIICGFKIRMMCP